MRRIVLRLLVSFPRSILSLTTVGRRNLRQNAEKRILATFSNFHTTFLGNQKEFQNATNVLKMAIYMEQKKTACSCL